jgi:hypothetical protein
MAMKMTNAVWRGTTCILPWLAVALVIIVTASINRTLDLGGLSFNGTVPEAALLPPMGDVVGTSKHLLARVAWGVPAIGFGLVAILVASVALFVIVGSFKEMKDERARYAAMLGVAAIGLLLVVTLFADQIMSEPEVMTRLRIETLHRTFATHAVAVDSFFDSVSYAIFLLLLCAASAALIKTDSRPQTIAQVGLRIRQVQWLLYVGAVALVLRDIEMYMLYRWPQIWFGKDAAEAIDRMALALSTAHGAFFSAILMALYLPSAFILRMRSRLIATQVVAGTTEQPDEWLKKMGFDSTPLKELAHLFATLTPLLAGGTVAKIVSVLAA